MPRQTVVRGAERLLPAYLCTPVFLWRSSINRPQAGQNKPRPAFHYFCETRSLLDSPHNWKRSGVQGAGGERRVINRGSKMEQHLIPSFFSVYYLLYTFFCSAYRPTNLPPSLATMEDSKLQRLHDTLKKLAPKGNHVSVVCPWFLPRCTGRRFQGHISQMRCEFLSTRSCTYITRCLPNICT